MKGKEYTLLTSMAFALGCAMSGYADSFHGTTFFEANGTEMVGMGYANNIAQYEGNRTHLEDGGDGYGAVGYNYWISKTEVSADQFSLSGVGNGNEGVGSTAATFVSLYEAQMYCNWLTAEAGGTTFAYSADGHSRLATHADLATSGELVYVIPSEDEWYKAAYYTVTNSTYSLYSTGSDDVPSPADFNYGDISDSPTDVGSNSIVEQNGSIGMMGNVCEWNETGPVQGGAYGYAEDRLRSSSFAGLLPSYEIGYVGFRVAAIPEPGSITLMGLFGGGILFIRRIFRM